MIIRLLTIAALLCVAWNVQAQVEVTDVASATTQAKVTKNGIPINGPYAAVAIAPDNIYFGRSILRVSKADADKAALDMCDQLNKGKCTVLMSYNNSCAAIIGLAERGSGKLLRWYKNIGQDLELVMGEAVNTCLKENGEYQCDVLVYNCSIPSKAI